MAVIPLKDQMNKSDSKYKIIPDGAVQQILCCDAAMRKVHDPGHSLFNLSER
jgi:hypothetical protein